MLIYAILVMKNESPILKNSQKFGYTFSGNWNKGLSSVCLTDQYEVGLTSSRNGDKFRVFLKFEWHAPNQKAGWMPSPLRPQN